jgi:hypothetical protein
MQPSRVPLVYFQAWICDPMHPRRVAGLQDSRATDVPAIYGARQSGHVRATRSPFTAPGSAASVGRGRSVGGVLMSPALPSRQRHCAKPPTSVGVAFDYHFVLQATALLMALMAIAEIVVALHMALMAVVTRLLVVRELTVPASSFISRVVVLQQGAAFTLLPCLPAPMVRETTTQNQALRSSYTKSSVRCSVWSYLLTVRALTVNKSKQERRNPASTISSPALWLQTVRSLLVCFSE